MGGCVSRALGLLGRSVTGGFRMALLFRWLGSPGEALLGERVSWIDWLRSIALNGFTRLLADCAFLAGVLASFILKTL